MLKPASLREALEAAVPELRQHPEKLTVFIDKGSIRSTYTGTLGFEYVYTLRVTLPDYALHPDTVVMPVLNWLSRNQPELLANGERHKEGFTFEAEACEAGGMHLTLRLQLTERVTVTDNGDGSHTLTHHPEPPLDPYEYIESWRLFVRHPGGSEEEIL